MRFICGKKFQPLIYDKTPLILCYGGRGSGKSEFAARKLLFRAVTEGGHNFLLIRKINVTIRESMLAVVLSALDDMRLGSYTHNKTNQEIVIHNTATGIPSRLIFGGLDHWQKLKSIKGITGYWVEEMTELGRQEFIEINLAFRDITGHYPQGICTFNPDAALAQWIKADYFDNPKPDIMLHHSTVYDNPIPAMRKAYIKKLEALCGNDPMYRKVYIEGQWAALKGRIFSWDVQELPPNMAFDIWYGGDFGFSIDPAAVVKVYKKSNHYWLQEILYERELTNQALAARLKSIDPDITKHISYWDSAEPKSIAELRQCGLRAYPAEKGPDSVRSGIDLMKSLHIHIIPGSPNLIEEARNYRNKCDKNGEIISPPEPIDHDDHTMAASRYAIFTAHHRRRGKALYVTEHDVY